MILNQSYFDLLSVTQVLNDTGSEPLLFETDIRSTLDDYFNGNYSDTWNSTLVSSGAIRNDVTLTMYQVH